MQLARLLPRLPFILALGSVSMAAQLPDHPKNLKVLPRNLSTDSVFTIMLGVANALGVTCGFCHMGGDNRTWDSTNFASDVKPMKVTARAMFALVDRLNREQLPAIMNAGATGGNPVLPVNCMTCHRGAPRPVALEDTIATLVARQGTDSAIAAYRRIRDRYAGRMTYDLTEFPLNDVASRLLDANRVGEAVTILEENARQFPASANVAFRLGLAYEKAGEPQRAMTAFHKALALQPAHGQALTHLRALMVAPMPPG